MPALPLSFRLRSRQKAAASHSLTIATLSGRIDHSTNLTNLPIPIPEFLTGI